MYKTLLTVDLEKTAVSSRKQRRKFHSLSIDESVQIIVDDRSKKERDSVEERDVNFTYFQLTRLVKTSPKIDLEKKEIYPRKTGVSFCYFRSKRVCRSLSMIVPERPDSFEKREVNFSYFRSTGLSRSLMTMDLEKTEIHSESEGNLTESQ